MDLFGLEVVHTGDNKVCPIVNEDNRMVFDMEPTVMGVADGEYTIYADMMNYRIDDMSFNKYIATTKARVVNGKWDEASVLAAANEVTAACGYWGVYVEALDYNAETDSFELVIGS